MTDDTRKAVYPRELSVELKAELEKGYQGEDVRFDTTEKVMKRLTTENKILRNFVIARYGSEALDEILNPTCLF